MVYVLRRLWTLDGWHASYRFVFAAVRCGYSTMQCICCQRQRVQLMMLRTRRDGEIVERPRLRGRIPVVGRIPKGASPQPSIAKIHINPPAAQDGAEQPRPCPHHSLLHSRPRRRAAHLNSRRPASALSRLRVRPPVRRSRLRFSSAPSGCSLRVPAVPSQPQGP